MDRVDLHMHSAYSDGENTPSELVEKAAGMGLRAISLTDHDSVEGMDEAMRAGIEKGIEVVPGVELSVKYGKFKDLHLLGYYFNWKEQQLNERLGGFRTARENRGERMVERINERLVEEGLSPIAFEVLKEIAEGAIGRPHIARLLMEKGAVTDVEEAFQKYLIPYNVPKAFFTPEEAAEMMGKAGGLLVLAHPFTYTADREELDALVGELQLIGLTGIEAVYSKFTDIQISECLYLSRKYALVPTGGSDYHGESFPYKFGVVNDSTSVPYRNLSQLKRKYFEKNPTLIALLGLNPRVRRDLLQEISSQSGAISLDIHRPDDPVGDGDNHPRDHRNTHPEKGLLPLLKEAEGALRKGRTVILPIEDGNEISLRAVEELALRLKVKGCLVHLNGEGARRNVALVHTEKSHSGALRHIEHKEMTEEGAGELTRYCQYLLHLVAVAEGRSPAP